MESASCIKKARRFSQSPAVKLALIYAAFFGLLCAAIFGLAHVALTQTIEKKHLKAVENKAREYRAWFLKGDIGQLKSRMSEQSLQAGDILFVRIHGEDFSYTNFTPDSATDLPYEELKTLDSQAAGNGVILDGEKWTIVSIPLDDGSDRQLQAGKNSQALKETLSEFRQRFFILFIPGALFAIFGSILLAHRFLSPIRHLTSTIQTILKSGDLSQRAQPHKGRNELTSIIELFNQLLGRNEQLIGVMQESLDNIAHDLRSPLSRIKLVSERALSSESESYENAIEQTAEEVDYMERLLTVLMNVAEAQSGALTLKTETVTTDMLLGKVYELYELVAEEKQIDLNLDCPETIDFPGDKVRLLQSLANLVDNAIKYSSKDTQITLRARSSDDWVLISVIDEGLGISKTDLPHIWDRLFRADRSRSEKGMGLGLSYVKAIIEAHGGKVSVDSDVGKGSTFSIDLPTS